MFRSTLAMVAALLAVTVCAGESSAVEQPVLHIDVAEDSVRVSGDVSSDAHAAILRRLIVDRFGDRRSEVRLDEGRIMPPGWSLLTEITLAAASGLRSGEATADSSGVRITGVVASGDAWRRSMQRIEAALLPGMKLEHKVVAIEKPAALASLCARLFESAGRSKRIEFNHSSTEIRTSAAPILDEVIQLALDCPGSIVVVTGHSDSTGDEAANLAISFTRANAVADYLRNRGLDSGRITVSGVGSAEPLVPGESARERRLNRRVEVAVQFP